MIRRKHVSLRNAHAKREAKYERAHAFRGASENIRRRIAFKFVRLPERHPGVFYKFAAIRRAIRE